MGTVSKALSLLTYFSRSRSLIGLSEMSRLSGLNKATVHRLLTELQDQGFVEQAGTGREYRLGVAFLRLAALREAAVPMRDIAMTALTKLAEATGETAHISLLQGSTLSTLAYVYSHQHGTRVTMEDAEVLPLHATSSGLAVLGFSDAGFVDEVLSARLEALTANTETNPAKLRKILAQVRADCMAESVGNFEDDVHTHAMPLFDARQSCIGALAIAAPVSRMDDALRTAIRANLRQAALRLTRATGGFLPQSFNEAAA
ncbi:IclR family transcriptional regulator [Lentibacter algarum]|uniref:IclR family transcriptional regulator n=1 Tax=Lentibacter algarum TaxID=576131 RepID=UPI001C0957E5|nr:IclR family transcriptional regulator [Lentibacter algarum]MBU2983011.1 IclR family transcriptional regulator [Lentibacter algarum]